MARWNAPIWEIHSAVTELEYAEREVFTDEEQNNAKDSEFGGAVFHVFGRGEAMRLIIFEALMKAMQEGNPVQFREKLSTEFQDVFGSIHSSKI